MKTTWEYSEETEAVRLIHCAHQMVTGFYRVNNFHVLPTGKKYKNSSVVSFPHLSYNKIPRFWEKVKRGNVKKLPIEAEEKFLNKVVKLFKDSSFEPAKYSHIEKAWNEAQDEVINNIYEIIPEKEGFIKDITIYPTSFGTSSSFNWIYKKNSSVTLYLRQDQDIWTITEALLTSLTRYDVYNELDGVWQESELLVDWLVTRSAIAKVLKKYQPNTVFEATSKKVRAKQFARLLRESEKYYTALGLPVVNEAFSTKNGKPFANGRSLENLTKREEQILTLLIENTGKVVSIDELANIIFINDDDFSLYAISKSIQRLRDKLEKNGISGSYIQTLRGRGYLLKN